MTESKTYPYTHRDLWKQANRISVDSDDREVSGKQWRENLTGSASCIRGSEGLTENVFWQQNGWKRNQAGNSSSEGILNQTKEEEFGWTVIWYRFPYPTYKNITRISKHRNSQDGSVTTGSKTIIRVEHLLICQWSFAALQAEITLLLGGNGPVTCWMLSLGFRQYDKAKGIMLV